MGSVFDLAAGIPVNATPDSAFFLTNSSGSTTFVPTLGAQAMLSPLMKPLASSDTTFFLHATLVPADVFADLTLPPW